MLQRFDGKNGIELVINTETGESFATQAGYCRMSGASKDTVSKRMQGVEIIPLLQEASLSTSGGTQKVKLIPENIIGRWLAKDNPELFDRIIVAGVRVFTHSVAGYQIKSNLISLNQPVQSKQEIDSDQFLSFFIKFLNDLMDKSKEMTVDQSLRFLDDLKEFNHIIMQYFKIGMIGNAKFLSACLGISDIYDHNLRLAVQVQKEYRESTEAKVQICEEIKEYIQPYSDEQLLTASELYEHVTGKKAPCYIVGKLANDLKKQGITYTNFKEKKKAYLLTPEIVEKVEDIIEVLKITQEQRVEEFFKECTEKSEKSTLTAEILYDTYKAYCEMRGWVVDTQTAFGREASKYATKIRKATGYIYQGITLK